ncbi:MAG: hypothetical protein KF816_02105 [Melioribacteraceae bacterium]|nr:hypothetical protein [Melioribacteraceae bacterium]
MNKKWNITWAIFLLQIVLISCGSIKLHDIINGGFEISNEDGSPAGWYANNMVATKTDAEFQVDNSIAHTGEKSIKISISGNASKENKIYNWIRSVDAESGIYELNGWVKTEDVKNSPFIEVQCFNKNKMIGSVTTARSHSITGTKTWQLVKLMFTVPKGSSKILIRAGISSARNNGSKVWFDDFTLNKVR